MHHAILEEIESKVQTVARGRRVFPYAHVAVTLLQLRTTRAASCSKARSARSAGSSSDIREALEGAGCEVPRGFAVEVRTAAPGAEEARYRIEYHAQPAGRGRGAGSRTRARGDGPAGGGTGQDRARRVPARPPANQSSAAWPELTDADQRVIRRNDVVFRRRRDEANATVSRKHAHIKLEAGEYRICDDESEFGTRIFRDGRPIEVPAGNRRGERLRAGRRNLPRPRLPALRTLKQI